jgi:hypothetical protein
MKQGDTALIDRIAHRAVTLREQHGAMENHIALYWALMHVREITTVHRNIVPLRLAELLGANDGNFAHDVFGIHDHLLRGPQPRLGDCFVPRFAEVPARRLVS